MRLYFYSKWYEILESLAGRKTAASEHKDRAHFCVAHLRVPGTWPSAWHRVHMGWALKKGGKEGRHHLGGVRSVVVTVRGAMLKPALRARQRDSPGRKRPFTPKTAASPPPKHQADPIPEELFIKRFQKKPCLLGRHVLEVSQI